MKELKGFGDFEPPEYPACEKCGSENVTETGDAYVGSFECHDCGLLIEWDFI